VRLMSPEFVVLMRSTAFAYPQVTSRRFTSSSPLFPLFRRILRPGSIPGSSTKKSQARTQSPGLFLFAPAGATTVRRLRGRKM
jgi:hypothetical protein